jgi:hypothetical protein
VLQQKTQKTQAENHRITTTESPLQQKTVNPKPPNHHHPENQKTQPAKPKPKPKINRKPRKPKPKITESPPSHHRITESRLQQPSHRINHHHAEIGKPSHRINHHHAEERRNPRRFSLQPKPTPFLPSTETHVVPPFNRNPRRSSLRQKPTPFRATTAFPTGKPTPFRWGNPKRRKEKRRRERKSWMKMRGKRKNKVYIVGGEIIF